MITFISLFLIFHIKHVSKFQQYLQAALCMKVFFAATRLDYMLKKMAQILVKGSFINVVTQF
jgi:hypothetical protein